jgi:hypothetical protein
MRSLTRAVATLALGACTSMYIPQSPGRVSVVLEDGHPAYVRDGAIYPAGAFGGGLVDAVAGNPAALAAARTYHQRMAAGLTLAILGLVAETAGALTATGAAFGESQQTLNGCLGAMLGGAVAAALGGGLMLSAEPYRWDAINLFNDGVGMRPIPQPGPYAPPPYVAPPYGPQAPQPQPMLAPPGGAP